jgi:hypothetical protein
VKKRPTRSVLYRVPLAAQPAKRPMGFRVQGPHQK